MNRREMLAASGALAVSAVLPSHPVSQPADTPRHADVDASGGFIVPAEFVPMITCQRPLVGRIFVSTELLSMEEVCRLRGVSFTI